MGRKRALLYGIGVNDADYVVHIREFIDGSYKTIWRCPYYTKWNDMIRRCYCNNQSKTNLSYAASIVAPEWHYFMAFREWMIKQDWQGKQLDKDLLIPGNKVYGPETCVFLDEKVNIFLVERDSERGEWPIGVSFHKRDRKFQAYCRSVNGAKRKYLGLFDTPEEAHQAWLTYKLSQAIILASEQTDGRVAEALILRYQNYKS